MSADIAHVLSEIIAVGIIFVGARFLAVPRAAASAYGVPVPLSAGNADAYLAVKAVRDIASGLFIAILLAAADDNALAWFMAAAAIIPTGDAIVVLRHRGSRAIAFGVHGTTAAALLVTAALLRV